MSQDSKAAGHMPDDMRRATILEVRMEMLELAATCEIDWETQLREWAERLKAPTTQPVTPESRALDAVVSAVRRYLPPDGISKEQFIREVILAVDNPETNRERA